MGGEIAAPYREFGVRHAHGVFDVPLAQTLRRTAHGHHFIFFYQRSGNGNCDHPCIRFHLIVVGRAVADAIGESRRVVRFVPRLILPAVVDLAVGVSGQYEQVMSAPFVFHCAVVVAHKVEIIKLAGSGRKLYFTGPFVRSFEVELYGSFGIAASESCCRAAYIERFAPVGAVVYAKSYFHDK